MGFIELLTILFIVLKLIGVITWSWWLVLLPEIIAVSLYVIVYVSVIIYHVRVERKITNMFDKRY